MPPWRGGLSPAARSMSEPELTASDTPTRQVPPAPVRGAHERQFRTDIDRHDRALTSRTCHPPPEASRREAKSECGAPRAIHERVSGLYPNPAMLLVRYAVARLRVG